MKNEKVKSGSPATDGSWRGSGHIGGGPSTSAGRTRAGVALIRRTGIHFLVALVALVALAVWANHAVEQSIRRQLQASLNLRLASTEEAVRLWEQGLFLGASELTLNPQFVDAADALAHPEDRRRTTTSANAASFLTQMNSVVRRTSAAGYVLTDLSGKVLSSTDRHHLGIQLPLPAKEFSAWTMHPKPRLWPPVPYPAGPDEVDPPYLTITVPVISEGVPIAILGLLVDSSGRFSEILELSRPGETGDTFAFDAQGRMVSRSRFLPELKKAGLIAPEAKTAILNLELRDPSISEVDGRKIPRSEQPLTEMAREAISGKNGINLDGYTGYRGVPVVGAWKWYPDIGMGLATEVDVAEGYAIRSGLRQVMAAILSVLVLVVLVNIWSAHHNRQLIERSERAELKAQRLGQYSLTTKLGEGGMGAVYLATHAMLRRPTAIKLMRPPEDGAISPERFSRFEREVQLTAELTHPNTIAVFDYGKTPQGVLYYAMEYLDGMDLDQLVRRTGAVNVERALHFMHQICGSLHEAHQRGMIHRDIKPGNIMVCQRGGLFDRIKVLDFGLAKSLEGPLRDASVTQEGAVTGTPLYMAPELLAGAQAATNLSDLYAIGAVLYFLLSGQDLFPGRSGMAVLVAQMSEEPRPLSQLNPDVPAAIERVVHRALAKDPKSRQQSVREFAQELEQAHVSRWTDQDAEAWWAKHSPKSEASEGGEATSPSEETVILQVASGDASQSGTSAKEHPPRSKERLSGKGPLNTLERQEAHQQLGTDETVLLDSDSSGSMRAATELSAAETQALKRDDADVG